MVKKVSKLDMWNKDVKRGIVYFDKHFSQWMYQYSELGWTDEIFLGETEEEAFRVYCMINW